MPDSSDLIRDFLAAMESNMATALQESYARGWRDAIAAVTAKAAEMQGVPTALAQAGTPLALRMNGASHPAPPAPKPRGRPSTAVAAILDVIREHPGLRGVDIVAQLEADGRPTGDRTVRSALRRLKGQEVWQCSHRWYPKKSAGHQDETDGDKEFGEALGTPPH